MQPDQIVSAMFNMVDRMIDNKQHAVVQGIWNYAMDVDSDLSSVNVYEEEFRYVRKLDHVSGLVAGDPVLLLKAPDCPLVIIGRIVGDITLAGEEL